MIPSGLRTLQPPGWASAVGYSNGIAGAGEVVFVSGQIGWNPTTGAFETDDLVPQVRQALLNVRDVLAVAGARTQQVARLTWYILDRGEYMNSRGEIGRVYREVFGAHYPAMSLLIVSGLLEPRARVEIEATALISR